MSNIFCFKVSTTTFETSTAILLVKNGFLFISIGILGIVNLPVSNCVKPYFLMSSYLSLFLMVSMAYDRITSNNPKFLVVGKTTFDEVSTTVFMVSLNSAPILFLVVSIETVAF